MIGRKYVLIILLLFQGTSTIRTAQKDNIKSQTAPFVQFRKITEQVEFPPPYVVLDSLLFEFYYRLYLNQADTTHKDGSKFLDGSDIPDNLLLSFAKTLVWKDFYPRDIYYRYLSIGNTPKREQFKRFDEATRAGKLFDETFLPPMPGFVLGKIIDKHIRNRLPWIWYFIIKNRYILIVKPITKENRWIDPEYKIMKADYYNCKVIQDIKGNYDGPSMPLLGVNYMRGNTTEMEIGKKYLVLIPFESTTGNYGPVYVVRGLATDGIGIFPVFNGKIFDPELILNNEVEIPIQEFKQTIRTFIHNTAGVPDEKE